MKILIIDDDKNYRTVTEDLLNECGYECRCLQDSSDYLKVVEEFNPDVILCDLKMPTSGFEVAYKISKSDKKPIVFGVSSYFNLNENHWLIKLCNFSKIFDKSNITQLLAHLKEMQCQRS